MIDPSAILRGPVEVHPRAYVGPHCVLGSPDLVEDVGELQLGWERRTARAFVVDIGEEAILLSHVVVGEGTRLAQGVWCDHGTYIGCHSEIGPQAQLMYGARVYHRVTIGERAWIGGFVCNDAVVESGAVMLGALIHRFVSAAEGLREASPIVRRGAFVGMGAQIIGGIEVGEGAYIAAGAVLTKAALPGRLYLGCPARQSGPAPRAFGACDCGGDENGK